MNAIAVVEHQPRSVLADMSARYGMEPAPFEATLRATVCKGSVSREEFAAFLLVAKEYRLNPLTKEIYAFPAKGGGIQPIVSIDGWCRIINEQPVLDGIEFVDVIHDGALQAVTCRIYRKDRSRPTEVTEYMAECKRGTDVWKTWPARMLRHKALIQCARYAFGFSGIVDPDEYERTAEAPQLESAGTGMKARMESRPKAGSFNADNVGRELDAITDAEFTPAHDPETGEAIDELPADGPSPASATAEKEGRASADARPSDTDDFPGDKRSTAQGGGGANNVAPGGPSLSGRIAAFKKRALDATSATKLASIWAASAALRNDLDAADPDTVEATAGELETFTNELMARLETAERETR